MSFWEFFGEIWENFELFGVFVQRGLLNHGEHGVHGGRRNGGLGGVLEVCCGGPPAEPGVERGGIWFSRSQGQAQGAFTLWVLTHGRARADGRNGA